MFLWLNIFLIAIIDYLCRLYNNSKYFVCDYLGKVHCDETFVKDSEINLAGIQDSADPYGSIVGKINGNLNRPFYWIIIINFFRICLRYVRPHMHKILLTHTVSTKNQNSMDEKSQTLLLYSQVANRRGGFNKRGGQNFFQNSINGGVLINGGVGNQTLKRKNLLWFIAKISLIRLVDE